MKTNKQIILMEGRELATQDRSAKCEELLLMKEESDKRVRLLQYLNTTLLTLILAVSSLVAVQFGSLVKSQSTQDQEIQEIRVIQSYNSIAVTSLDSRVKTLEINWASELKSWVEENYVRKPQR